MNKSEYMLKTIKKYVSAGRRPRKFYRKVSNFAKQEAYSLNCFHQMGNIFASALECHWRGKIRLGTAGRRPKIFKIDEGSKQKLPLPAAGRKILSEM